MDADKIQVLTDFIDLFYPRSCAACERMLHQDEEDICLFCQIELPRTNFHLIDNNPVERLFWGRMKIEFASAFYYFVKQGKVQRLLHNLKYHGCKSLGSKVGYWFGIDLKQSSKTNDIDFIVPVPLHPKKLALRRYYQSEYIACGLSNSMEIEMKATNLVRSVHTSMQTRNQR